MSRVCAGLGFALVRDIAACMSGAARCDETERPGAARTWWTHWSKKHVYTWPTQWRAFVSG